MVKKLIVLLAVFAVISCINHQQIIKDYQEQGYEILEHSMGQHAVKISESYTHIFQTDETIHNSPSLKQKLYEKYQHISHQELTDTVLQCQKYDKPNYFNVFAWPIGTIGNQGKTQQALLELREDACYSTVFINYTQDSSDSYTIELAASGFKGGVTCTDAIQIATTETFHFPVVLSLATKRYTISVTNQSQEQMDAVQKWGIHLFQTCDKITNLIPDLYMTLDLFIGGLTDNPDGEGIWNSKPTESQTLANLAFLLAGTNYQWEKRENPVFVDLQDTEVHSGDFIIITRFDGVDNMIQWGTGGHVGHTCVFLEMDGEMYVVESQDGWYWPRHGIQKNLWSQWKIWALNAGFNVAILPLSDEKRATFQKNIDSAIDFFNSMEGYPYGYHNFLFGWLDDVPNNIPPITTIDYFWVLFCQLEKVIPDTMTTFVAEAMNKRLGTENLNLPQIANTAWERGMSIADVMSIPEQDSWIYSDGPSNVCSSFVTRVYKAAGLFEGYDVQGTEFTPRDVCQLNFWNTTPNLPEKCTQADPNLPYCQVMGNYVIDVTQDHWNEVQPYDNMYESCPSMTPLFERDTSYPNGC